MTVLLLLVFVELVSGAGAGVTPSAILTNTDFVYSIQDAERRDQDTKQLATLSLN